MKRLCLVLVSILLIGLTFFGCASSSRSDSVYPQTNTGGAANKQESMDYVAAPSSAPATEAEYGSDAGKGLPQPGALPNQKMIWNGELQLESTDYEAAMEGLYALIEETGSYIQSSSVTGEGRLSSGNQRLRNARLTVRVPSENFSLFIQSSGQVATLLQSTTYAQDVSDSYFDTEARLKVLRIKEERLIEMLAMASDKEYASQLQYILQIESELSNVRYEIESLTGTLRRYDSLIAYSTLEVYLSEVEVLSATPGSPASLGDRIASRFRSSLNFLREAAESLIIWFIGYLPILIPAGLIVAITAGIVKKSARRNTKKRSGKDSKDPNPPA